MHIKTFHLQYCNFPWAWSHGFMKRKTSNTSILKKMPLSSDFCQNSWWSLCVFEFVIVNKVHKQFSNVLFFLISKGDGIVGGY